jgi:uncharacterized protein YhaN
VRLRAIEAVRYGALRGVELGPFGDGLNVVFGGNEAGKSTLASLVRHVLFGYSRKTESERGYYLEGDEKRAGRLVFEDADAERWVLSRTDGRQRGAAELVGPAGQSDAAAFVDGLSRGVSAELYRQVFGFSLEELADFKSLDAIQNHLHAGVTGLESNPREALVTLEERAGELYRERGRRRINELDRELRELRKERRELVGLAGEVSQERERIALLDAELAERRQELSDLVLAKEHRVVLSGRIQDAAQRVEAGQLDVKDLERSVKEVASTVESIRLDDDILAKAASVDRAMALVDEYEARGDERGALAQELDEHRTQLVSAASSLGPSWDADKAIAFQSDPAEPQRAESFSSRADGLDSQVRAARTKLDRSTAETDDAEHLLGEALGTAGLQPDATEEDIAVARTDVDAALSGQTRVTSPTGAFVLLAVGLALIGWGVATGDVVTGGLGLVAAASGMALLVVRRRGDGGAASVDAGALVKRKGCLDVAADRYKEVARARRRRTADQAELDAAQASAQELAQDWGEWCDGHGLSSSGGPAAGREVARRVDKLAEAGRRSHDAERALERTSQAVRSFEEVARSVGVATEGSAPASIAAEVRLLAERLDSERGRADEAAEHTALLDSARADLARREAQLEQARDALTALLAEADVESPALMEASVSSARQAVDATEGRVAELAQERAALAARVAAASKGDELARLSLRESELLERLRAAIERYAVAALAIRILSDTLAEYERERQPEVLDRASQMFATMTGGRYRRISTPLGEFDPAIFDASDAPKDNEKLSTGTAQQLYLALRLAYIDSLGGRGPALPVLMDDILVNFDDERRADTAELLVEFAAGRQVVLFTCHRPTAEALSAVDPEAVRVLEL